MAHPHFLVMSFMLATVAAQSSSLERQCTAMSGQFTAVGKDASCAAASSQMPAIFSTLEGALPSGASACDLTATKALFTRVDTCSGLAAAFNGYCHALGSCASGGSVPAPAPDTSAPSSPSPSPSPPPAAPTLVLRLKIIEITLDPAMITKLKEYFVTLFAGAGLTISTDDIALSIPGLSHGRRRLLNEMSITVTVSLAPDAKMDELVDTLSKPSSTEAMKTSFVGLGLTLTSLDVAEGADGGKGSGLSGGAIAGIVIGTLAAMGAIVGLVFHFLMMKKKDKEIVKVNKPAEATPEKHSNA